MGAARHTQRHQEQAQRRIARSEPVAQRDEVIAEWTRIALDAQAERDRLRAALDGITIAMKQRAISARAVGNVYAEGAALDVLALIESYGFGGDQ